MHKESAIKTRQGSPGAEAKPLEATLLADAEGFAAWLNADGEMTRLIRQFDWSKAAIGPEEEWSPALKMVIRLMLANRFPMILWWGPRHVQFYNDPYIPIPGNKHPRSLGQEASACWKEIWPVIGPLIETPFHGGPATWAEDILLEINRHGFVEETHFTIAYSPVPDETAPGGIGGVLATVHEISEKIVGERRVAVLRDLGARSTEAKTAEEACAIAARTLERHAIDVPFALLYLIDADRKRARLAGVSGAAEGVSISVPVVGLSEVDADDSSWPLGKALKSEKAQTVPDLAMRFGSAIPPGPWSDPPRTALVAPIRSTRAHVTAGFLVAGVSSRLRLDENYRGFLELAAGQVAAAIANARDYEEERRRAESLAQLDRAKTAFFSNVSHEFRTPLSLMLGPVEDLLLRSHTDLPPAAKGQLEVVNRNGLRLLRLVNTLLDFSRIEAGRVRAAFEPTDLAAFTAELASVFRAATEKAGLSLTVDCPGLPEPVYVDRDMWEKIVLNLVSNAFKFTFEGGIEVKLRADAANAILTVRDTGVGIPAEEIPRLFERFHRVENMRSRTHEGSGIGLSLVLELVKLHGGAIRAESTLGAGAAFIVTVPLGDKHLPPDHIAGARSPASTALGAAPFVEEALRWLPEPAQGERTTQPAMRHEPMPPADLSDEAPDISRRPRIIIADDNADMRHYLAHLLSERYNVEMVPDGRAALAAARGRRPDLILSDVMMPHLDGFGLVRELRADTELKTIPIILLSARAGEESRVEGLGRGADDYLIKPFSARELVARVSAHLEMARMRKEAAEQIRKSEERFRVLVEHAPVGISETDLEGRFMSVNPRLCEITGYSCGELLRMKFQDITHPDDVKTDEGLYQRTKAGEIPFFTMEKRYIHKDGHVIWVHLTGAVVREEKGQPSFGIAIIRDISDRKQAEESLRFEKTRLQVILDNLSVGMIFMDGRGNILTFNKAALEMHGFKNESEMHTLLSEYINEFDLKNSEGNPVSFEDWPASRAVNSDFVKDFEVKLIRKKSGEFRSISYTAVPIFDSHGELTNILLTLVDITERKNAAEELRRNETRFRSVLENSRDVIYRLNLQTGRYEYISPSVETVTGFSPDELTAMDGVTSLAMIHPDDVPACRSALARLDETGEGEVEYRQRTKNGDFRWLSNHMSLARDAGGRPLYRNGNIRDINERKRAEETLAAAHKQLQSVIDNTTSIVYAFDPEERFVLANTALAELLNSTPEQMIGKRRHEFMPKRDADWHEANDRQVFEAGRALEFEESSQLKGHSIKWLTTKFPLRDAQGRIYAVAGISADITERKQMEIELTRRADELAAANRELESFSYSVSHDLRGPIHSIQGFSEILLEDYGERLDEDGIDYLNRIKGGADKRNALIDDMMSLFKISRQELFRRDLDLSAIVEGIVEDLRGSNPDRKIEIKIQKQVHTNGDSPLLTIALSNLLRNAWKFTSKVENPLIEFGELQEEGRHLLYVRDNGAGFDMKLCNKLFKAFQRLHSESEFPGTGIGLAIVERVIRRHGGKIWAESEPGKGATFYLLLGA
jgi:PAS domain S-box-containing protein